VYRPILGPMVRSAAFLYPDWAQHNARLRDAVRFLTAEQLQIRAGPEHGTVWQLAAHAAGTRVYWVCAILGEPGADRTPFTEPNGDGWEDDEAHPRSGEELAWALDTTFGVVREALERWTPDELDVATDRTFGGITVAHTRASVLSRMFSHDAFHAGEISQLLGLHHLPEIDLWRRPKA
jgi:uncharacterized damage-inducible protein DinB